MIERFYYDSKFAKTILLFSSCHTITIGPFVFSKMSKDKVGQYIKNHETIHTIQWSEICLLSVYLISIIDITTNISAWWYMLSLVAYYIWYIVEWIINLLITWNSKLSYSNISFEIEARTNQKDSNYIENRPLFNWIKFIGKM